MSNYKFIKQPVIQLPAYTGFKAFGKPVGLDSAYEVIDNRTNLTIGSIARSGKEWVGYVRLAKSHVPGAQKYRLQSWGAASREEALALLLADLGIRN